MSRWDEDLNGIDCYIYTGKEKPVPLQLKQSIEAQWEHQEKYPNIPSLAYTRTSPWNIVLRRVKKIYGAYKNGQILHLNAIYYRQSV